MGWWSISNSGCHKLLHHSRKHPTDSSALWQPPPWALLRRGIIHYGHYSTVDYYRAPHGYYNKERTDHYYIPPTVVYYTERPTVIITKSAADIITSTTDQIIPFDTGPTIHPWYTVGVGSFVFSRKMYGTKLHFAPCSVIRTFALLTFCGFYAIVRAWKFKQSSVPSRLPTFSHSQTAVLSVRMRNSPTLIERETAPLTLAPKQIARSMSSSVSERANT